MKMKNKKLFIVLFVLAVCIGTCFAYLADFYRADSEAIAAFALDSRVQRQELEDGVIAFIPEDVSAGLIFYPGGKVEHTAYEPLMRACADRGILCVLIEMPFNLAVFDLSAADGIQAYFPDVSEWYMGGHSLGGSMAASYLADNADSFEGLILLGSYSTADLSKHGLEVLSIYGSEDGVMNREKYEENMGNLPERFGEIIIEGGNHAGFGSYGEQEGDGVALISGEEQLRISADAISDFIK